MNIDIGDEIAKALSEYSDKVVDVVNESIRETGMEAVKTLRMSGGFKDRTGKYRKGWALKKGLKILNVQNMVVYNKVYQITHLLEYGHVNRDGSRTQGFEHIAPVQEMVSDNLEVKLRSKL